VPLAVALRQVLPPGYGFSIDQDVDLNTLVSFKGGQPWRETLQDMLQPVNLSMREQGQMVSIGHVQSQAIVPPAPLPEMVSASLPPPSPSYAAPPPVLSSPPVNMAKPLSASMNTNLPKPELTQPTVPPIHLAPSMTVAASPASAVDTWTAMRGDTLRKVLGDWSRRAGVEMDWLAEYDYPLQASISFNGTFEAAVRSLLSGFEDAHPQPVAALHANSGAGQTVLVVETRGNSNSD
jgi:hypothetical protein